MGMLPIYDLTIEDNGEVNFNSLVDSPAHGKGFVAFNNDSKVKYQFDDEKRMVTGVMISANTLIYRGAIPNMNIPEHYVKFSPQTIEQIVVDFHKKGYGANMNTNHSQVIDGVFMVESYIVGDKAYNAGIPSAFQKQNLEAGTWIATYKVDNPEVWDKVKSGEFYGFSIEGLFTHKEVKIKTNTQMKKRNLFGLIFGAEKFAEATTVDGVVVFYDGELAEGTQVFVEADGERIPAPEGEHQIATSDTTSVVVMLDAQGIVTSIEEVTAEEEMTDAVTVEEVTELMSKFSNQIKDALKGMSKEITSLSSKLRELETGKFQAAPRKTNEPTKVGGWKSLIAKH